MMIVSWTTLIKFTSPIKAFFLWRIIIIMQKSNKSFIIVGDPHLNHSRVSTRIDDISLTALEKLDTMADIAAYLCKIYDANYDLLITGCLLHDLGKIIELEGPIVYKYSLEGKLLGHISIMVAELKKAAEELKITSEVPLLLEHMVLSHHGQPDFGSPVLPSTKEALLLSLIDNLDSKMVVVNKAIADVEPGNFSNKVFPLDNRAFYKPKN